ncbi:MAG: glutathione S-transferase [Coriobacteriia bacterium]|nr:glutathione S-transferase [Coriobacteriia bacterium]
MTTENPDYTLYYWPVPLRGHILRAILSFAGADWEEGDPGYGAQVMNAAPTDQPVPFMGLPLLIDHTRDFALSQMPAIAFYLGEALGLLPDAPEGRALCLKVVNDTNDVLDEITLQGGMLMWTDESWQAWLPNLRRWMGMWEALGARYGLTETDGYLLGTPGPTIADVATATLWVTMCERFHPIGKMLMEEAPLTAALAHRMWATEALANFGQDTHERYGDAYCGGQIEASLRQVVGSE